jgi:hypothetical protein
MCHEINSKKFHLAAALFFFFTSSTVSFSKRSNQIINNQSVTKFCEELLDDRENIINKKNKILELLNRNRKLQEIVPRTKKTLLKKLFRNFNELRVELYLSRQKIQHANEDVIRKGCPGIIL